MTTVITCFDLPREAEAPVDTREGHLLHRSIGRPPASFGWIDVADLTSAAAAAAAVRAASEIPAALAGAYDEFHVGEQPAAPYSAEGVDSAIIFVNCMRFAPEHHDAAFEAWAKVNAYMVKKPGYRWHRLHRRIDDTAPFGLVNVVEWESPDAWQSAHDEGFRALTGGDLPFTAHPTLCLPVTEQAARV